jgi:hypothetical protein
VGRGGGAAPPPIRCRQPADQGLSRASPIPTPPSCSVPAGPLAPAGVRSCVRSARGGEGAREGRAVGLGHVHLLVGEQRRQLFAAGLFPRSGLPSPGFLHGAYGVHGGLGDVLCSVSID